MERWKQKGGTVTSTSMKLGGGGMEKVSQMRKKGRFVMCEIEGLRGFGVI